MVVVVDSFSLGRFALFDSDMDVPREAMRSVSSTMAESSASAASAAAAAMDLAPSSALMVCENRGLIDRDHQVFRAHDWCRVWMGTYNIVLIYILR